ncbi:hypothetical protein [Candidatus Enterococcus courvalinii]|uniref:Uncharacterized protein n=1 Tax=Candidatus Enterococcus courvalinii TaxID=2815329 RepID=A0ABS3HYK3_9ENTE|nr:hypothetical protein [Enterococcus sp. MSG2901]MBO0481537.1 hypothetical protein [Enterococcus sp. MSG2901]
MTDNAKELKEMYGKIQNTSVDDIHEALKNADNEEEREFYTDMIRFIMQTQQKKILKRKEKIHGK